MPVFCETVFDRHGTALDITGFTQAAAERGWEIGPVILTERVQEPDHRQRRLLRACRERPHRCPAAEQRDELASSWIEHGLLPGTRCASLPQAQDAPEAPAGPWRRPEMF